jgi:hypothetical protein
MFSNISIYFMQFSHYSDHVTGWTNGVLFQAEAGNFSPVTASRPALGHTQPPPNAWLPAPAGTRTRLTADTKFIRLTEEMKIFQNNLTQTQSKKN